MYNRQSENINNPSLLRLAVAIEEGLFFIVMNDLKNILENKDTKQIWFESTSNPCVMKKPKQYQIGIDTFERAEANLTKEEIIAICKFNIDKYCWRQKDQDKEDFQKIIKYAEWALKNLSNAKNK